MSNKVKANLSEISAIEFYKILVATGVATRSDSQGISWNLE